MMDLGIHPTSLYPNSTGGYGLGSNGTGGPIPPYWEPIPTILLSITMGIFMVVAIFGNTMVILVISRHKGMRTRTNMFLCNLAIADLLTAVLLMPVALATVVNGDWLFNEVFCQINGFTMPLFFVASIHTLMYISIHKYITITRPFTRCMTRRRILVMIGAAWFWAALTGYLTVHGLNTVMYKPYTAQCGPRYPTTLRNYMHPLHIGLTCYLIPFIIMIFCYAKIFREMREHSARMRSNSNLEKEMLFRQQRRITVTLFVVLALFVVSWTPYVLYSFYMSALKDKTNIPKNANAICYWFGYMNSACNPIIYALRSQAFREGYKELWCWKVSGPISEDALGDSLYSRLFYRIFPTEPPTDRSSAFQRLQVFIQNSIRNRSSHINFNSSSGTPQSDSLPASRKVSAGSMAHFLIRPLNRRISTNSLPETFRHSTMLGLPKASHDRRITFHEPLNKASKNSGTNGALEHSKFIQDVIIPGQLERNKLTPQSSPNTMTASDLSPVPSEGTPSANGIPLWDESNVFITTADVIKPDARTPSPNAPLIHIVDVEAGDNEHGIKEFKRRFLDSKSVSALDPKFENGDEANLARSSSESNVNKMSTPGFLKSLFRGFQSKTKTKDRRRLRSTSSSSERKSSYSNREESSVEAHSPPLKPKKMSLTVPAWKSILRSLSEDSHGHRATRTPGGMHKAASDSLYVDESGNIQHTDGRKWWKRQKDKGGKLFSSDEVRLSSYQVEDDQDTSVVTMTHSDEERKRLHRTFSDRTHKLPRFPSVEHLDRHHRSQSFNPARKKRRRKKKTSRVSKKEKSIQIEPEFTSLPYVGCDIEFDRASEAKESAIERSMRPRSWSDPCITFHILENKLSVWRTSRARSRRHKDSQNTPVEFAVIDV